MYQRIIALVAGSLFALIAVLGAVMTDLNDRSYPEQLGATSALYLDFSGSATPDDRALGELARLSEQHDLGLVRILPDLAGDKDGQVFVPVGEPARALPTRFRWYGDQPAGVVRGPEALAHSFATGQYLVTGSRDGLDAFTRTLSDDGVRVNRVDNTVGQSASFLFRQESFRATLTAGVALLVSMALFWLSVRSRGRALRVLGGVSAARIQAEDLGRLALTVALPAIPVTLVAVGVVAATHGTPWLPFYAATLVALEVAVVLVTLVSALVMSLVSWPSVAMLARRQPAVNSLRRASGVLKAVTFVLVLLTVGPAWWAYGDAQAAADQQARWRNLSDQVALRFPSGLGEKGFVEASDRVGDVVKDADTTDSVALSYAMDPSQFGVQGGPYDSVVLVNKAWLRLMDIDSAGAGSALRPVGPDAVPRALRDALTPNLDLWARSGADLWGSFRLFAGTKDADLPMASAGNGDLVFPEHPLLLEVGSTSAFTDDFLASLTSTDNLIFNGLDPTLALLRDHDLATTIQVKYAAEDGVLRAQFASYEAWLRGFALAALAGAFLLALAVSAFIASLIHARRDFPLRLDGRRWTEVLRTRVGGELVATVVLGGLIVSVLPPADLGPTVTALLAGLAGTALAHVVATRWTFRRIADRTI